MGFDDWTVRRRLARLLDRVEASDAIRQRARQNLVEAANAAPDAAEDASDLRLLTLALAELCIEKGLVTEDELRDRIRRLDEARSAAAKPPLPAPRRRRQPPAR